jgi:predicted nucleic acid-binding protein
VLTEKEIVVKDACILFDLIELNLVSPFFNLDLTVLTTPQVIAEIMDLEQLRVIREYIETERLVVDGEGELEAIDDILGENKGLSFADSSVLELAIRKNATVLSSDGSLRKVSIKQNLTVRGMLWIIEELYNKGIVNVNDALNALSAYATMNPRTPKSDIDKLILKLSTKS